MEWIKLAIPLIGLAIWIIGQIMKNYQEQQLRNQQLQSQPPTVEVVEEAKPATEISRYLEEVRRRKQTQEDENRRRPAEPMAPPPVPGDFGLSPAQGQAKRTKKQPKVQAIPSDQPPPRVEMADSRPVNVPPTVTQKYGTRSLNALEKTIHNPETLGAAFLLREILNPPVSRRRRR